MSAGNHLSRIRWVGSPGCCGRDRAVRLHAYLAADDRSARAEQIHRRSHGLGRLSRISRRRVPRGITSPGRLPPNMAPRHPRHERDNDWRHGTHQQCHAVRGTAIRWRCRKRLRACPCVGPSIGTACRNPAYRIIGTMLRRGRHRHCHFRDACRGNAKGGAQLEIALARKRCIVAYRHNRSRYHPPTSVDAAAAHRRGATGRPAQLDPSHCGLRALRIWLCHYRDLPCRDRADYTDNPLAGAGYLVGLWRRGGTVGGSVDPPWNIIRIFATEAGIFLSAVLVGGKFMGLTALGLIQAKALASGDPRRTLAYMTGAFGIGQIIGPAFAGVLSDRLGSFTVPSIGAVIALILAAFLTCR